MDYTKTVSEMIDSVVEGQDPFDTLSLIEKKRKITPGMMRAMGKNAKYKCVDCDMGVPKYTGAYSKRCSNCDGQLVDAKTGALR